MSIVKSIGDFFKSAPKDHKQPVDRFAILSPLFASQKYIESTVQMITLMQRSQAVSDLIIGHNGHPLPAQAKGIEAYHNYVKGLANRDHGKEKHALFSTMLLALESITKNLDLVEDNISQIFDVDSEEIDPSNLRTSSLVVVGYIETAGDFANWIGTLFRHLTADENEVVTPFESKTLNLRAHEFGDFASFNIDQWNGRTGSILTDIKTMQHKGLDVALRTGDNWLDTFVHDGQFSTREQALMSASFRNPIMMAINWDMDRRQAKIDLMTARNEWLIAKIDMESRRMSGLDPESPDYTKLKKATDYYSNVISEHEQKIGRLRA